MALRPCSRHSRTHRRALVSPGRGLRWFQRKSYWRWIGCQSHGTLHGPRSETASERSGEFRRRSFIVPPKPICRFPRRPCCSASAGPTFAESPSTPNSAWTLPPSAVPSLEDLASGRKPIAVVATAGTVSTGSIDPLPEIADICREHSLWLHVDGAYGALASLAAPEKFAGLNRADSLSLDPHKWLYQPAGCGCLLYRDPAAAQRAFAHSEDYARSLSNDPIEGFAFFEESMELSRPFRALKIWLSLALLRASCIPGVHPRRPAFGAGSRRCDPIPSQPRAPGSRRTQRRLFPLSPAKRRSRCPQSPDPPACHSTRKGLHFQRHRSRKIRSARLHRQPSQHIGRCLGRRL